MASPLKQIVCTPIGELLKAELERLDQEIIRENEDAGAFKRQWAPRTEHDRWIEEERSGLGEME